MRTGLITDLLTALDTNDVDLVLGPIHADLGSQYAFQVLDDERLVLITRPGHAITRDTPVSLAELRDEAFVYLPTGSGLRAILTAAAAAAAEHVELRVQFETNSPIGVRELIAAGLGVALLAYSAAPAPGPPVTVRELASPPAHPPRRAHPPTRTNAHPRRPSLPTPPHQRSAHHRI